MLYAPGDASTYRHFIEISKSTGDQKTFEIFKKLQHDKLDRLIDFCSTGHCRRRILLQYFNEHLEIDCGNCDGCLSPVEKIDGTQMAQKILSAIYRTDQKFGIGYIVDLLRGVSNDRMEDYGHCELPTFGVCEGTTKEELMFYTNQLISLGYIQVDYEGFIKTLSLNELSKSILNAKLKVELIPYTEVAKQPTKTKKGKKAAVELTEEEEENFEQLKLTRQAVAKADSVPAFVVFSNATLIEMVKNKPRTKEEFGEISGVGAHKLEKYWPSFKQILR